MNPLSFLIAHLFLVSICASAQSTFAQGDPNSQDAVSGFQPSLAVVIGVLCIMFSATFILLIYAKFCYRRSSALGDSQNNRPGLVRSASRFSGIDKTVIESLPFFRFSSLKGSREGLECAVCLSKFEDIEILRLLPKCKHAFHINCVDQWLEKHSSCPLCRRKVSADDPTIFTYSNSMRSLWNPSELRQDSNVELFVQREETRQGSSRFSIGSSFRKVEKANKEKESLIQEAEDEHLHKFNHKIIVSDVVFKNRWSNVSSSDLMFLNSEMLNDLSSNRFSSLDLNNGQFTNTRTIEEDQIVKIKEELEIKRLFENKISTINKNFSSSIPTLPSTSDSKGYSIPDTPKIVDSAERRSVSEITGFSRFRSLGIGSKIRESSSGSIMKEERQRQLWLPIARKTVQWFANREMMPHQTENTRQKLDV